MIDVELTCPGIPYRIHPDIDGKPTIKKASTVYTINKYLKNG